MNNNLVTVKHKPVYHRGKAYGVGSIIDAGSSNDRGALLAGGCVFAKEGAEAKRVPPKQKELKSASAKPAPKKTASAG